MSSLEKACATKKHQRLPSKALNPDAAHIGTSDEDGLVDLVSQDFRLDEVDRDAVDADQALALL